MLRKICDIIEDTIYRMRNLFEVSKLNKPPLENKRNYLLYLAIKRLKSGKSVPISARGMPLVETWDHPEMPHERLLTPDVYTMPAEKQHSYANNNTTLDRAKVNQYG